MGKLDPIISEFETEEQAQAYDLWFRAQVKEGLRSKGPFIPHETAMRETRKILKDTKAQHANASLGS